VSRLFPTVQETWASVSPFAAPENPFAASGSPVIAPGFVSEGVLRAGHVDTSIRDLNAQLQPEIPGVIGDAFGGPSVHFLGSVAGSTADGVVLH